jgi:hypothetical protein
MTRSLVLTAAILTLCAPGAPADCALFPGVGEGLNKPWTTTIRQKAAGLTSDGAILYGRIAHPRREKEEEERTDFLVEAVQRQGKVKPPAKLVLSRCLEIEDAKNPPRYLLFCDREEGKFDPFSGIRLSGGAKSVDYVKKVLSLDPKKPAEHAAFYFAYLEDADPEVTRDAFLEMALASDRAILAAAHAFSAEKLRAWLKAPKTPAHRLSLYGQLLGACGKDEDAKLLRHLLASDEERYVHATDGLLLGYVWLRPNEGWKTLYEILADRKKDILTRFNAVRVARFVQQTQPTETRSKFIKAMRTAMRREDMADIPIDELRKARIWALTDEVLKLYGKKGFDGPLLRRAIIRYALSCEPTKATKDFLAARGRDAKELVAEVEEGLNAEAKKQSRK